LQREGFTERSGTPSRTRSHPVVAQAPVASRLQSGATINIESDDEDHWENFSEPADLDEDVLMGSNAIAGSSKDASIFSAASPEPEVEIDPVIAKSAYSTEALHELKKTFKVPSFRYHQLEAINATMEGRDVFVLMPTGGGKSICYQVPAICESGKTKGVTFVISPLIALMTDQVAALRKKGVDAVHVTSEMNTEEFKQTSSRLYGSGKKPALVYVAPERLQAGEGLTNWLNALHAKRQLARFVIDEAHCISTWGRDFRDAVSTISFFQTPN
jgi:superfamily II DNA helicase RecQ